MSLPDLNEYGFLPQGIHESPSFNDPTLLEMFVKVNDRRQKQWNQLLKYLENPVVNKITDSVYIDGSFVSDKHNPGDIDIVLALKEEALKKISNDEIKEVFDKVNNRVIYGLEVFPHFPNPDPSVNDFTKFFQYVDPTVAIKKGISNPREHVKGIIKISL